MSDRVADFNWSLDPLIAWFSDTVSYHVAANGWVAWVVIAALILIALLVFDATSYITELVTASGLRSALTWLMFIIFVLPFKVLGKVGQVFVAKSRDAGRALGNSARRDE